MNFALLYLLSASSILGLHAFCPQTYEDYIDTYEASQALWQRVFRKHGYEEANTPNDFKAEPQDASESTPTSHQEGPQRGNVEGLRTEDPPTEGPLTGGPLKLSSEGALAGSSKKFSGGPPADPTEKFGEAPLQRPPVELPEKPLGASPEELLEEHTGRTPPSEIIGEPPGEAPFNEIVGELLKGNKESGAEGLCKEAADDENSAQFESNF